MQFRFIYGKLAFEEIRTFLLETDFEFPIPLSACVDIDSYAKKLSEFSDFAVCRDGERIIGMISCYTNQPPIGYISNVCVKRQFQGNKVFSRLLDCLLDNLGQRGIHILKLEVDRTNEKALSVYRHVGFKELEDRCDSNKVLMTRVVDLI